MLLSACTSQRAYDEEDREVGECEEALGTMEGAVRFIVVFGSHFLDAA